MPPKPTFQLDDDDLLVISKSSARYITEDYSDDEGQPVETSQNRLGGPDYSNDEILEGDIEVNLEPEPKDYGVIEEDPEGDRTLQTSPSEQEINRYIHSHYDSSSL